MPTPDVSTDSEYRCWWFGINNVRRVDHPSAHVTYPAIEPFLRGEVESFNWPHGGSPGSHRHYERMQPGDRVVFWMGDGYREQWGIVGFGVVSNIDRAAKHCTLHRWSEAIQPITPYPSRCPARTEQSEFLRKLFSIDYRPLRKLFFRLGYEGVKPCVVTIDEISNDQFAQLVRRAVIVSAPTAEKYATAFQSVDSISANQILMLRIHYHAPDRTVTASQLASAIGLVHYSVANSQYERLARQVGKRLNYNPMHERLGTLVTFEKRNGEWHWLMRPQVAQALEQLGWVDGIGVLLPEEIATAVEPVVEGEAHRVLVNSYERDSAARQRCIAAHGTNCCICGFDFGAVYGSVAEGFIHIHHLRPLSEVGKAHKMLPEEDLRPVCPNCHAVLHRRIPAYSI